MDSIKLTFEIPANQAQVWLDTITSAIAQQLGTTLSNDAQMDEPMTPAQVCKNLNISKSTLNRYIKDGLKYSKVGAKNFFTRRDINQYLFTDKMKKSGARGKKKVYG